MTLEQAYREHDHAMRRLLTRTFPSAEGLVDDAVSEAWVIVAGRFEHVRPESFGGYLYTVARHELIRLAKRAKRQTPVEPSDLDALVGGHEDDYVSRIHARERAQAVMALLRPREQRAAVGIALGLSYDQLAAATGTTFTNVNKHLSRGRARARLAVAA